MRLHYALFSTVINTCRAALAALLLSTHLAVASPSMETDDAGIVDHGSCQIEAWGKYGRGYQGTWLMPACSPINGLELALAGIYEAHTDEAHAQGYELEAKQVLLQNLAGFIDVSLSVHFEHLRQAGANEQEWHLNLPVSAYFLNERLNWHNNVGAYHDDAEHRSHFKWGTGLEYVLSHRVELFSEVFGNSQERPFYQLGAGYWLVPETLQFTLGMVDSLAGSRYERAVTASITIADFTF
ncbi:MAG TPA: hypothetical protein VK099_01595 [Alcanivoracaceae bacterium]|nr:hypothetical protein [Alcanivoracaceae bacterium]